jgi:hypothetical protein
VDHLKIKACWIGADYELTAAVLDIFHRAILNGEPEELTAEALRNGEHFLKDFSVPLRLCGEELTRLKCRPQKSR